jgi:hypothetical protein
LSKSFASGGGLAGLGLVGGEAADEGLQLLYLLFGLLVLVLGQLLYKLAGFVPEVVVAHVHLYLAVVYVHDVGADVVEEVAVVAHHQHRALIVHEKVFQPHHGGEVQVVGGLVQQYDVRISEQRLGQQHLDLQSRVHVGHLRLVEVRGHAQTLQQSGWRRIRPPSRPAPRYSSSSYRRADAVFVGVISGLSYMASFSLPQSYSRWIAHDDGVQ